MLRSRSASQYRTLGRSRRQLAGLLPLIGKACVSKMTVPLSFVVGQKALAMAPLSVVASPFAILPLPPSQFRPLPPYCPFSWHLTAKTPPPAGILLLPSGWHPSCYSRAGTLLLIFRSVDPSSVTPSRGIALPLWLSSNTLDRCNDLHNCASGYSGLTVSVFFPVDELLSTPLRPAFLLFQPAVSFVLGSLLKR